MNMGERIKERRKMLSMTQEELGSKVGLQKSAISKYERGAFRGIKSSMIKKIATVLECDPVWLIGYDAVENIQPRNEAISELIGIANQLSDADVTILINMARRML